MCVSLSHRVDGCVILGATILSPGEINILIQNFPEISNNCLKNML